MICSFCWFYTPIKNGDVQWYVVVRLSVHTVFVNSSLHLPNFRNLLQSLMIDVQYLSIFNCFHCCSYRVMEFCLQQKIWQLKLIWPILRNYNTALGMLNVCYFVTKRTFSHMSDDNFSVLWKNFIFFFCKVV
jgi:hypothetical protein